MSTGNTEAFLQPNTDDIESQNERQDRRVEIGISIEQVVLNVKQLKSVEILRSALKTFTSNTKFMLLMILSILPFFVFMVLHEIKLQKSIFFYARLISLRGPKTIYLTAYPLESLLNNTASNSLKTRQLLHYGNFISSYYYDEYSQVNERREFLSNILQLSVFYLFLYPFLGFFSMILTMKVAVNVHGLHAEEKPATLREVVRQKINLKGPLITYICVHLLSFMTLIGFFWIVANHQLFTSKLYAFYIIESIDFWLNILSIAVHSVIFLGLLYKYLEWSAFWNMGIMVSVLEEHSGITALGMSDYYGKHCKKIGFQLMLGFFVFGNILRLPCLYAGLCNGSVPGVLITSTVMMLVSLGILVKWVSFLLYFYYCKQQTMEKKVDDHQEVGKTLNTVDLS